MKLHVVLAVDRAGLVGEDGATHHGVFDVGFLRQMPGMKILAPASLAEQQAMLRWAVEEYDGPVAIRYPRGGDCGYFDCGWQPGRSVVCHRQGSNLTFITYGTFIGNVLKAAELLARQGVEATVLRMAELTDLDEDAVISGMAEEGPVVIIEETCTGSGIREELAVKLYQANPHRKICGLDLGRDFIPHGAMAKLYESRGLNAEGIAAYVKEVLGK